MLVTTAEFRAPTGRRGPGTRRGPHAPDNGHATNGAGRPPPHDLDAERALIGAMLVPHAGVVAIEAALAAVAPDDFYKPAHAHVVAAIYTLSAQGSTVDLVTVADQLRRDGLFEAAGGDAVAGDLVSMMGGVPAISNAAGYASIIAGCARRRHLRHVAAAIDDAAQLGDEAALERALETAHEVVDGGRAELVVEDLGAVIRGEEPEIVPTMLFRSDGRALIYPGLLHWIMGEPGCGKTWLALVSAWSGAQVGATSLYLDYEGSRRIVGGRMGRLGATEDEVTNVAYVRPSGGSQATGPAAARLVRDHGAVLMVIDGVAKALARDGLDEDNASDVLGWLERMVWPVCEMGAAVVVLDHVPKDKDARGRWARGSGAKLGEVDGAAYNVRAVKPWSRSKAGYASIDVAKDREGVVGAVGDVAALLKVTPTDTALRVWLDPPASADTAATIVEAVEKAVNDCAGTELSQVRLEHEVREYGRWRNDLIRSTAESLASSGRIHMRIGPRNARLYSSIQTTSMGDQPTLEEDL